jgi:hypothetical protein
MVIVMSELIGERILNSIKLFQKSNVKIDKKILKKGSKYVILSADYRISLMINPIKWIGMEFELIGDNNKTILTYDIDTDLYPISTSKYYSFAYAIEEDIVHFLQALTEGKIKVGKINGKPAMLIPKESKYILIKKGWLFTSSKIINNLKDIELNAFESLSSL